MSTFNDKLTATRDFLENRASLNRVTTYRELCAVVGELLYRRNQRHIATPVSREKMADVLKAIDDESDKYFNILLSALVVHFFDNKAGHRFFEQQVERGLIEEADFDTDRPEDFHEVALAKVFAAFPEYVAVELPEKDDDTRLYFIDMDDEIQLLQ